MCPVKKKGDFSQYSLFMFSSVYTCMESLGGGQRTQVTSSFHPAAQTDGPKCPTRLSLRSRRRCSLLY